MGPLDNSRRSLYVKLRDPEDMCLLGSGQQQALVLAPQNSEKPVSQQGFHIPFGWNALAANSLRAGSQLLCRLLRELYWEEQFLLFPWKAPPLPGKAFIWLLSRVLLVRPWRADETEPKTTEASLLCCF